MIIFVMCIFLCVYVYAHMLICVYVQTPFVCVANQILSMGAPLLIFGLNSGS